MISCRLVRILSFTLGFQARILIFVRHHLDGWVGSAFPALLLPEGVHLLVYLTSFTYHFSLIRQTMLLLGKNAPRFTYVENFQTLPSDLLISMFQRF